MEDNDFFVMERASLCNRRKRGRIYISVFSWNDFRRDRKGEGGRGKEERKHFFGLFG